MIAAQTRMKTLALGLVLLSAGCGRSLTSADGGLLFGPACSSLGRDACQDRPDCLTTLCQQCSCTPVFKQCRAVGELEVACPALGCAQPFCCSKNTECAMGQACSPPGGSNHCGACLPNSSSCAMDSECGPSTTGKICKPVKCSCNASMACQDGCKKNEDCTEDGEVCNPTTLRCGLPTCSATVACPSYFDCVNGACQRKTCTTDANCPHSFCVTFGCFAGRGTCQSPVP
jgi:hypothetical protein